VDVRPKFRAGADEPDYVLLIRAIREAVEEIIKIRGSTILEGVPPDEVPV
jgi:hypothetical protein